jgi:hypothetical protein
MGIKKNYILHAYFKFWKPFQRTIILELTTIISPMILCSSSVFKQKINRGNSEGSHTTITG